MSGNASRLLLYLSAYAGRKTAFAVDVIREARIVEGASDLHRTAARLHHKQ